MNDCWFSSNRSTTWISMNIDLISTLQHRSHADRQEWTQRTGVYAVEGNYSPIRVGWKSMYPYSVTVHPLASSHFIHAMRRKAQLYDVCTHIHGIHAIETCKFPFLLDLVPHPTTLWIADPAFVPSIGDRIAGAWNTSNGAEARSSRFESKLYRETASLRNQTYHAEINSMKKAGVD